MEKEKKYKKIAELLLKELIILQKDFEESIYKIGKICNESKIKACLEVGDFIPIIELANVLELSSNEEADKMYDEIYKNINKSYVVRKIEKRLKRLQKQVSRKYEQNKKGKEYVKTKNIIKLEKQIQQVYRRLANIRSNYLHKTTTSIVKTKPYRVVIEDLNVKGMMKNKHLSDAIRKQGFYEFKRQLEYKCKFRGIQLVVADRFYPSSKTCSQCGEIKKDLKLKDRVYKCSCGLSIDRDLNASINLSRYKLA